MVGLKRAGGRERREGGRQRVTVSERRRRRDRDVINPCRNGAKRKKKTEKDVGALEIDVLSTW